MAKDEVKITVKLFNQEFNKGMKEMSTESSSLNREFKLQQEQMKHSATETEKLGAKMVFLNKKQELAKKKVEETEKGYATAKKQFGENSKAAEDMAKKLDSARIEEQQLANQIYETNEALNKQVDTIGEAGEKFKDIGEAGEKLKDIGGNITDAGKGLTAGITAPLVAVSGTALKAAIDFESAFAGVRKTVDATEDEFAALEKGIRDMAKELPASATDISAVAEAAGQLGIEKENILEFTRTMIDLGESTNMTADEASTNFAQFANVVGMPQDNFDKLGSSVVALGNNMATTEKDIVNMGMRLSGVGKQVGLSEADIMGLAATMSSVGISAEAGGSAMTQVLKKIGNAVADGGKDMGAFAKASGMSSKDFATAWKDDPITALDSFVKGLGESGESGENLNKILGDLGIKGINETDTLLRMAGASELLGEAVDISSVAWEENTALTEEARQRYETTESQLAILWNKIKDVGITLGQSLIPALLIAVEAMQPFIDMISRLAEWFAELDPSIQTVIIAIAAIAAAIGPVLIVIGMLISAVGQIMIALGPTILAISEAGGVIALLINPITLTIAAVIALIAIFVALYKNNEEFRNKVQEIWASIKEYFSVALSFISDIVSKVMKSVTDFFGTQLTKIRKFWDENGAQIMGLVKMYFGNVWAIIQMILGLIKGYFQAVWPAISGVVKIAWESMKLMVNQGITLILGIIRTVLAILRGDWKGAWNSIKDTAKTIWKNIEGFFKAVNLVQIGKDIIQGLINGISSMAGSVKKMVSKLAENIPGWAKDILGIRSPSTVMIDVGEDTGEGAIIGVENKVKDAKRAAAELARAFIPQTGELAISTNDQSVHSFAKGQLESLQSAFKQTIPMQITVISQLDGQTVAENQYNYIKNMEAVEGMMTKF